MSSAKDVFKNMSLGAVELRHDRRVKVGNFLPDKKTKKFYRIHPTTVQKLDVAISKMNYEVEFSKNYVLRDLYAVNTMLALNPPILVRTAA